jgi:lysophospholipase L1-like esterase
MDWTIIVKKSPMKTLIRFTLLCFIMFSCSTKQTTWVAIGDSITYLNEHQDETGNRITKGYMTRGTEKLQHITYVNKGYNGWTAMRIAEEIESLNVIEADVYSVFLGTNDWWHSNPLGTVEDYLNNTGNSTFFGAYRTIISKLQQLNKNARIILITPMQRGDFVYIANMKNNAYGSYREKGEQALEQFANAVITIGQHEKIEVVDLFHQSGITLENMVEYKRLKDPESGDYKNYEYPEYVDVPFNPETDEYPYPPDAINMTYDGLHPSDKGYEVISRMLVDLLKQ